MLKSFVTTAIRNLKKNRLYTFINVLGLSLGIACCLVIFVIVRYETSFDDYHSKAERIYRVNLNQVTDEGRRQEGNNYSPLAETIRRDVTGLDAVTGVYCLYAYQFSKDEELFESKYAFFADQQYFDVFDVKWIAGNQAMALTGPNTAVVTDRFADDFLGGSADALGKTFLLENKITLTVSGIAEAPPTNTDHPYTMLISYPTLATFLPESLDNWENIGAAATYVVFGEKTTTEHIYPQLNSIIRKHLKEEVASRTEFFLMPLNDNHDRNYDYSSFTYDFPVPVMIILSIIAGMIAFIACINFVNLATAQSLKRAKEVGLRKTMGCSRLHLIAQYMSEAFFITALAVIAGMVMSQIGMMKLNETFDGHLQFNLLGDPLTLLFLAGITVAISVIAGFYPAFILSGYKPVLALKSQTYTGTSRGFTLRRGLVISQFAGAQILILLTIIMINQISFFKDRPIGYDPETVVLIPALRGNENQEHAHLARELQSVHGVSSFTFGNAGNERAAFYVDVENRYSALVNFADTSYIHTFESELLAGKNLSVEGRSSNEVLVNEALVKTLGLESPASAVGSSFSLNDHDVVIRGVVQDTYTQPLSSTIDPVIFRYDPEKFTGLAIKISTDQVAESLTGIERAWKQVYPDYICRYFFMDDVLNRQYGFFNIAFSLLGLCSFLAIFIGCLGLYGLVSFMAIQRTKEIGIRKVFGATVSNIILLFTKESAVLIVIAFILAAPLSHFLGIALLMEFPERVSPGIGIFAISLFGSMLIAMLTVAWRSFNAAVVNPADSLRVE